MQRMKNEFAAFVAERMFATMFPPDAILRKGESFSLNLKAIGMEVRGIDHLSGNGQCMTLLMNKTITEAVKERLLEEYRQGGGVNCQLQYASSGRVILSLTIVDRNGDTLIFTGPKQIELGDPAIPNPAAEKKRKYVRKINLVEPKARAKK